jgi:hypothetical protein
MSEHPDLSWWKEPDTAQVYAWLKAQLYAINKLPYSKRRDYIEHEIRCANCDSVVVQVVTLKYPDPDETDCRVIRSRASETLPLDLPDPGGMLPAEHGRLAAAAVSGRPTSYRAGEWRFEIATPDDGSGRCYTQCKCAHHDFTTAGILARQGRRSTAKPIKTHPLMR